MAWLLLAVTAIGSGNFHNEILSQHSMMSQCHVAATQISWEEQTPDKELLCIQVSEEKL